MTDMTHTTAAIDALPEQIWRIDTAYKHPGLAACYLIQGGEEFALVECGSGVSVEPILKAIDSLGVARDAVRYIIPTHVHLDHAGGAGGLLAALPNARLYVHPRGLRHLVDPSKLLAGAMAVYGEEEFRRSNGEVLACDAARSFAAEDGAELKLGDRVLVIRDAPGHAHHHLAVWDARSRGFFTGDVFGLCYPELAAGGRPFMVPTTTPVQFAPEKWHDTLALFARHDPLCMYLTHYGRVEDVARLGRELAARVDEHASLGRAHAAKTEAELARILGDALFKAYQTQGGELSRAAFGEVLAMDLALNAQGLQVWQQAA